MTDIKIEHHGVDVHILYVNVYDITRCFGGPEEGGWWYDAGECIEIHRVAATSKEECVAIAAALRTDLSAEFPRTAKRYSVLGGEDYDIFIQDDPGSDFPEVRPHYE